MMEVSSSLGIMIEVDWQGLFNSFFSLVRVKIQCKDPTKIPRKRVFVFKSILYLIEFKTEGFDQEDNALDDGPCNGGGEDNLKEDEPKVDEAKGSEEGSNPKAEGSKEI